MKRPGKCVSKRAYSHRSHALEVAQRVYMQLGQKKGIYECPSCLDFHLTSSTQNLKEYYTQWDEDKRQLKLTENRRYIQKKYNRFLALESSYMKKHGLVKETRKKSIFNNKKNNTLPLEMQKILLADFNDRQYGIRTNDARESDWGVRIKGVARRAYTSLFT